MKRFILLLLWAGLGLTGFSQRVYFLYLQTEPVQPFYVKLNGKLHSSSAGGYLIISKLVDSTYTFSIGFNQPGRSEQTYTVKMAQKDHGFLVKDFGEKGWGIFDLQTLSIQYSSTAVAAVESNTTTAGKEVSPFTDLLSKATGDPSLREQPPAPKAEVKPVEKAEPLTTGQPRPDTVSVAPVTEARPDPVIPVGETNTQILTKPEDTIAVKKLVDPVTTSKEEKKEEPVVIPPAAEKPVNPVDTVVKVPAVPEEKKAAISQVQVQDSTLVKEEPLVKKEELSPVVYTRSIVTKRSESSTTEGFGLVFLDTWEAGKVDTIRLLIPNPKQVVELVKDTPKTEKKFLDIQATAVKPENKPVTDEKAKEAETVNPATVVKSDAKPAEKPAAAGSCAETATETDFFALRKTMAAAEGDDEMISQAKKYFKQKCFTVAQLKNLGALFLNDEARYNFFDAAYKYTADKAAFASLEAELKDPYYINRFKAMIH